MSIPEETIPAAPSTPSSIVDSPKFQQILNKLNSDNDRESLTEIIKEQEGTKYPEEYAYSVQDLVSSSIAKCHQIASTIPGIDPRYFPKLAHAYIRFALQPKENPLVTTLGQISQGQAYDSDAAMKKHFEQTANVVADARRISHNTRGLTPEHLKRIDDVLDTVVPTQMADYAAMYEKVQGPYMEKALRSSIPPEIMAEAFLLLLESECAMDSDT
ncbi:hypothetical protein DIURU_003789 [Diutina rugosa]|uniref:Uncharacterized protein n=1 Tax=Diutina rugosa TaxID=5481 RepID=A0A642UJT6_DIURU|nr:uncharacterized protein DIURU_003789 [Diutina rugosa]KAA8900366.1 hypothetical protein DIURU_003789 [Diutina rugosa]